MSGEWRPIEELARGQEAILYYPPMIDERRGTIRLHEWITVGRDDKPRRATHWMPLPEPPK